jgi:hypothetical protein
MNSRGASRDPSRPRDYKETSRSRSPGLKPTKLEEMEEEHLGKRGHQIGPIKTEAQEPMEEELSPLNRKIALFLERLKSEERKDVEENAKILAKIIQHFSFIFAMETSEIMKALESQKGEIEINKIRSKFIKNN